MSLIRDTLKLARKWEAAGIEHHQAEKMVEALSDDLDAQVVTKADLSTAIADLKTAIAKSETNMTVRMATMLIAQVGVLFAMLKFFPS